MANRKTHRIINALALMVGGVCIFVPIVMVVLFAAPDRVFPYSAGDGRITFHALEPLPEAAAREAASLAWAAMQDTPFGQPDQPIDVYITGGRGWRHQAFFRPAPWAGGLTYPIFSTQMMFLRDVDLEAGRLIASDGPVLDPRDLTYYLVHEMTHLGHGAHVGPIEFLLTPHWIREAVPEIAALGLADRALMEAAMAGAELPRATFGSYPIERACATMVLASPVVDISELLDIRAPMHDERTCFTLPPPVSD